MVAPTTNTTHSHSHSHNSNNRSCQNGGHIESQSSISKPGGGANRRACAWGKCGCERGDKCVRRVRRLCGAAMPPLLQCLGKMVWCGAFSHRRRMRIARQKRRNCSGPLEGPGFRTGPRVLELEFELEPSVVWVRSLAQVAVDVLVPAALVLVRSPKFRSSKSSSNSTQNRTWIRLSVWTHNRFALGPVYLPAVRASLHLYPYLCICESAGSKCDSNFPGITTAFG